MNRYTCARIIVFLYLLILILMYLPIGYCAFYGGGEDIVDSFAGLILFWPSWILLGVLGLCQYLLLTISVKDTGDYEIKKRSLWVPLIAAGLLVGLLEIGIVMSISFAAGAENVDSSWEGIIISMWILVFFGNWILWWRIFRKMWKKSKDAQGFIKDTSKILRKGSLLELVVAIPCHIIVRQRGDCSAPVFTFIAIILGCGIALLSFGPGLYYCFMARKEKMSSKSKLMSEEEKE